MPSTRSAYPQVISRYFASSRVPEFDVSAAQIAFCAGFDSRQLDRKLAGQSPKRARLNRRVKVCVKI
jgi:hypothetical protein